MLQGVVDLADAAAVRAEFDPEVKQRRPPGAVASAEEIVEWAQALTIRGEVAVIAMLSGLLYPWGSSTPPRAF